MATNQMRREAAKRKLERQQERRAQQSRRRRQVAVITSAAVVVVVLILVLVVPNLFGGDEQPANTAAPVGIAPASIPTEVMALPTRPAALPATVTCDYPADGGKTAKPVQAPSTADVSAQGAVPVTVQISTGAIPLTLDRALAPCAVNSFVSLARQGYFDQTRCHRLTTDPGLQVLQCGDPTATGSGGPGYGFADETFPELTYGRGILAMANSGPNTNGSQFFMVYGDGQLQPNFSVFGSISPEGLKVIDEIARKGHDGSFDASAGGGAPIEPVTIQAATVG